MDQIDCFDGVNLLRRSGVNLLRRTGDNFSVFSNFDETTCNLLKRHKTKKPLQNNGFKGNETI
jgi:hypothetical protein